MSGSPFMVADLSHVLLRLGPGLLSESRSQEVERVETRNERDKKNYKASADLLTHMRCPSALRVSPPELRRGIM